MDVIELLLRRESSRDWMQSRRTSKGKQRRFRNTFRDNQSKGCNEKMGRTDADQMYSEIAIWICCDDFQVVSKIGLLRYIRSHGRPSNTQTFGPTLIQDIGQLLSMFHSRNMLTWQIRGVGLPFYFGLDLS